MVSPEFERAASHTSASSTASSKSTSSRRRPCARAWTASRRSWRGSRRPSLTEAIRFGPHPPGESRTPAPDCRRCILSPVGYSARPDSLVASRQHCLLSVGSVGRTPINFVPAYIEPAVSSLQMTHSRPAGARFPNTGRWCGRETIPLRQPRPGLRPLLRPGGGPTPSRMEAGSSGARASPAAGAWQEPSVRSHWTQPPASLRPASR